MTVELLYVADCPNWQLAASRLEGVARRRGLQVDHRVITSQDEAAAARFTGSPTVLIEAVIDG
ncbi:MAG TPA: hypothetical protein VFP61_08425 [Acidimicrobiales bacterium]|nr:hypothetical protein [Acidimicrobiales bacterium]